MKGRFRGLRWVTVAALALPLLALLPATAANAVTGAVSTTDNPGWADTYDSYTNVACLNGKGVNCNIYEDKRDVWLSGLPVSASLGAGDYFFAVLSPGGQPNPNDCAPLKANNDPANLSDTTPCETTTTGAGDTWQDREFSVDGGGTITYSGPHDFDSTNNKIQAFPYDDTPNNGGVYILAVCAVPDNPTSPPGGPGVKPSDCKYDAFKVVESGGGGGGPEACAPTITKDAAGTNDREYTWSISKTASAPTTVTTDTGQSVTFHYAIKVTHDSGEVQNVKVTGGIQVFNCNTNEDGSTAPMDISGVTDALSGGATQDCDVTLPGGGTPTFPMTLTDAETDFAYECDLSDLPSSQLDNTATVTWDTQLITFSDNSTATLDGGSADFLFEKIKFTETALDDCVTVTDDKATADTSDDVTLGTVCVGDKNEVDNGDGTFSVSFPTYDLTFTGPAASTCVDHKNTASFTDNSDPVHNGSADATVTVCSFGPRFTPGYWKNHLGKSSNPNDCAGLALPSGTSCSSNGPWTKAWANTSQWKCLGGVDNCTGVTTSPGYTGFKVNSILLAAKVFSAMSCSFSGNAANQNQQAIGCLAGHLLAAKYNRNINGSNPCINSTITAADALLAGILYAGPTGNYKGISSATRASAISLKSALDAYNNGGGCH